MARRNNYFNLNTQSLYGIIYSVNMMVDRTVLSFGTFENSFYLTIC